MNEKRFDCVIIGAGLSGLSLAKELSLKNKKILLLEKGRRLDPRKFGRVLYAATFYDKASLARSIQGFPIYRSFGIGGSSVVMCNNAVDFSDDEIKRLGMDIRGELAECKKEYGVGTDFYPVGKVSRKIMDAGNSLNCQMKIMPKFTGRKRCIACGDCVLGCRYESKWTGVDILRNANRDNITIETNFAVKRILLKEGVAVGVEGHSYFRRTRYYAEKIVVAAGGLGTPVILQKSGIAAGKGLFVDFFNVTYGEVKDARQSKEVTMSVYCGDYHEKEGFILSPYIDHAVAFLSTAGLRNCGKVFGLKNRMGIMTKIADENVGRVFENGRIDKAPSRRDLDRLKKGNELCRDILVKCGADPDTVFQTKPRGAHPGGTAAIGRVVDENLETKWKNLYVCDASVLPFAPGLPPVLTLLGLTKWFAKRI